METVVGSTNKNPRVGLGHWELKSRDSRQVLSPSLGKHYRALRKALLPGQEGDLGISCSWPTHWFWPANRALALACGGRDYSGVDRWKKWARH